MSRSLLARIANPWTFKRDQEAARVAALRQRDGDSCTRCRRPMRFDLPPGHDLGAKAVALGSGDGLQGLCLTHGNCNAQAGDNTEEVRERVRLKAEAALFGKDRAKAPEVREDEPAQ